jgi:hypothetical protein
MHRKILIAVVVLTSSLLTAADSQWMLQQSTLTYSVSHPLHHIEGVSHAARGKGICHAGQCEFLIAVPVNTFTSGQQPRSAHDPGGAGRAIPHGHGSHATSGI